MAGDEEARARAVLAEMQLRISQGPNSALGISDSATPEDVRAAFLTLTKQFHPARFGRMSVELQRLSNEVFLGIKMAHDSIMRVLGGRPRGTPQRTTGGIPPIAAEGTARTSVARSTGSIPRLTSTGTTPPLNQPPIQFARGTDRSAPSRPPAPGVRSSTPATGIPVRGRTPTGQVSSGQSQSGSLPAHQSGAIPASSESGPIPAHQSGAIPANPSRPASSLGSVTAPRHTERMAQLQRPGTAPTAQAQSPQGAGAPVLTRASSPTPGGTPPLPPLPPSDGFNPPTARGVPSAPAAGFSPPTGRGGMPSRSSSPSRPPATRPAPTGAAANFNVATQRGIAPAQPTQPIHRVAPAQEPFSESAALREAILHMESRDWTAARLALHALAAKVPQSKQYRALLCYTRGREAHVAGRGEDALLEYQRALQLVPDLPQAKQAVAELQGRR